LEDQSSLVLGDSDAIVDHGASHRAWPWLGPECDLAIRLAVLDRVPAEVHQDLREARAVGDHRRRPRRELRRENAYTGARGHWLEGVNDLRPDNRDLYPPRRHPQARRHDTRHH